MKTTGTFLLVILVIAGTSAIASDKYVENMKKHIHTLYTASSADEYQAAINSIERIGNAEKDKWEPFYYISFGYVMLATRESVGTQKDAWLDQATVALDKAKAILANDSEIVAMEGFIHMIRLTVDPGSRGPQYSGLAMQSFDRAVALNPNNPRALSLLAQMQLGTAQFFGSPITEACNTNKKALELFDTDQHENPLAPTWGKSVAEAMVTQCK